MPSQDLLRRKASLGSSGQYDDPAARQDGGMAGAAR
jgi:hypothetical protein